MPYLSWLPLKLCLKRHGREINEIQQIICTHGHIDHVGSVNHIKQLSGAKFYLHLDDAALLSKNYFLILKTKKFERDFAQQMKGWHKGWIQVLNQSNTLSLKGFTGDLKPDGYLQDEELIEISGLGPIRVISTPGHTRGSICLWHENLKVLFTGDTLLSRNGRLEGPRGLFSESEREGRRHIMNLMKFPLKVCIPGHFRMFSAKNFSKCFRLVPND